MNDNINDEFILDFDDVNNVGSLNFNDLINRPKYNGQIMSSETNIPEVKTYEDFVGTDGETDGTSGLVPAPKVGDENKFLKGDGTWDVGSQYELPIASGSTLGGIKVGNNLTINPATGVLDADGATYTAGANINISDQNVISATDTTYTAGAGLDLIGTEFSVDTSTIQPKLTAGSNITIDTNNEISADNTTYTAGNAIDITGGVISADIYPADYFTAGETVTSTGSSLTLNGTIEAKLNNVELLGNTTQQTYTGKNLYNANAPSGVYQATKTISGQSLTATATANGVGYVSVVLPNSGTLLGKSCTISFNAQASVGDARIRIMSCLSSSPDVVGSPIAYKDGNGEQTVSFTFPDSFESGKDAFAVLFYIQSTSSITIGDSATYSNIQLEEGSTATSYEPYVGEIASPNPDYPQDVNVVTGEQVVSVVGKNLYNKDGTNILSAYIDFTHQSITSIANNRIIWIKCKPSTTYTVSKLPRNNQRGIAYTTELPAVGVQTYGYRAGANGWSSLDFTTGADAEYLVIRIWSSAQDTETLETMLASVQIEEGSTATTFQPYQSQSYTVDLGSIELCKIGDYQDYIYKDGDDWYVRKEVGKSTLGTLNWSYSDTGTANVYRMYTGGLSGQYVAPADNSSIPAFVCTHFTATNANDSYSCKIGIASNSSGSAIYCYDPDYNTTSSSAGFKTWLSNNDVTLYYVLATPTDTQITDVTLISQLNALYNATSYEGQTNFEVTALSPNLPAILGVSAYKKSLEGTLGAIASKPNQDTTYSNFTGATSNTAGVAGLVPAPTTSDKDKYLKGDGTWGTVNAGPTVVQTTGSSTTDVMSQNAVTTELGNKEDKGLTVSIVVDAQEWNDELDISPYTKSVDKAWLTPLSSASSVELINDNPALFAKYGFAIQSIDTTFNTIKIVSIGAPDTTVSLTINVK